MVNKSQTAQKKTSAKPSIPTQVKPVWKGADCTHRIDFAFNDGVEDIFCLYDTFELSCERGLDCLIILEEMDMRCTTDFLKLHTQAIEAELKKNPINVFEIYKLNSQLKERAELIIYPKLIKKLSSYFYFDQTENPYIQNQKYADEKIKRWEEKGLDFFLLPLIRKLIEPLNLSAQDLGIYSQVVEKIDQKHLENLYSRLSEQVRSNPIFKELTSINTMERM